MKTIQKISMQVNEGSEIRMMIDNDGAWIEPEIEWDGPTNAVVSIPDIPMSSGFSIQCNGVIVGISIEKPR